MARTNIPVLKASPYLEGNNPTATAGTTDNHEVSTAYGPVVLIAVNTNASTVVCNIPTNNHPGSFNIYERVNFTVPAAAGGVSGVRIVWLDAPDSASVAESGTGPRVIRIDTSDANAGDVSFYAVAATATQR